MADLPAEEVLSPTLSVEEDSARLQERVSLGYEQLEKGDSDSALATFQSALLVDSKDLSALLGRAMIHAERMDYAEAFTAYDSIVRLYPQHALAWNRRGLAAFNMEDFDLALVSFERATESRPVNGFFYESIAWTQMCRGEYEAAAQSAKTASLMYSREGETSLYPVIIAYLASFESGDTENAIRALEYAKKNRGYAWPGPVVDYLAGSMTAADMISCVTNRAEETEAHTYIGLQLLLIGEEEAASRHLDWVGLQGDPSVFEYTLARALRMRNRVATVLHEI
ncbi:MAG: tetratricopeptide repeat protein [Coraliomargaritaceae bacterium]